MSRVAVTDSYLTDIADVIRAKKNTLDTYTPSEMAGAIASINGGGTVLKIGVVRPDAELVTSYSYDKMMKADEKINPIAYTTTSTTVKASTSLSPTVTCDFSTYDYYVIIKMVTIPSYNISTTGTGREEYAINAALYEITQMPANTMHALVDTSKYYASAAHVVYSAGNFVREVYYSKATTLTYYASAAYGYNQTAVAPALNSGTGSTLTLKSPTFIARGSTSYFTKTYMNAVTDVRYQYKIEVWRAPRNNLNLNGWGLTNQWLTINNDVLNNNGTLT